MKNKASDKKTVSCEISKTGICFNPLFLQKTTSNDMLDHDKKNSIVSLKFAVSIDDIIESSYVNEAYLCIQNLTQIVVLYIVCA